MCLALFRKLPWKITLENENVPLTWKTLINNFSWKLHVNRPFELVTCYRRLPQDDEKLCAKEDWRKGEKWRGSIFFHFSRKIVDLRYLCQLSIGWASRRISVSAEKQFSGSTMRRSRFHLRKDHRHRSASRNSG